MLHNRIDHKCIHSLNLCKTQMFPASIPDSSSGFQTCPGGTLPCTFCTSPLLSPKHTAWFRLSQTKVWHRETTVANQKAPWLLHDASLSSGTAEYRAVCFRLKAHPKRVMQSVLMSWWIESGVLDEGDMLNVQGSVPPGQVWKPLL